MNENIVNQRSIPSQTAIAAINAANRSSQNSRIAALANPNAALQDLQEEVAFAFGEKMQSRNAENEKVEERNASLLKEFARKIKQKNSVADKTQEPLQHKIENAIKGVAQQNREDGARGDDSYWNKLMSLSNNKAALFLALGALQEKNEARGDLQSAQLYAKEQARCAKEFAPQIRAAINIGEDTQIFAKNNNLPAEQVLDAYQKTVADYSGILTAALTLTEKLGVKNSASGAEFIRKTAAKEISMLKPSVEPEHLLHVIAELKGLQVLATIVEQVDSHRKEMGRSEKITQEISDDNSTKSNLAVTTTTQGQATHGIAALGNQNLVTGVLQSAVKPQSFQEKLDLPARKAYSDMPKNLIMHLQGLHKIFKNLPEYVFPDRLDKQRALLPLETRLDNLIALEREGGSA